MCSSGKERRRSFSWRKKLVFDAYCSLSVLYMSVIIKYIPVTCVVLRLKECVGIFLGAGFVSLYNSLCHLEVPNIMPFAWDYKNHVTLSSFILIAWEYK